MRVAVLMTCFNRAYATVECLRNLAVCAKSADLLLDVWLNDDGSTDGTSAAVQKWYGENNPLSTSTFSLHLICGSGFDYWCGGMRRVWRAATGGGVDYDGYLWLNDDTMLYADALTSLFVSDSAIVVGAVQDPDTKALTYSGRGADGKTLAPNGVLQPCVMMNGNAVYVPRAVFKVLGNFPDYFTHSLGDYDYARRAAENGIGIFVAREYVGTCRNQKSVPMWTDPQKPLAQRWCALYSPLSGVQPRIFFRYNRTHDGLMQALRLWRNQHLRVLFPRLWGRDGRGRSGR